MPSQRGGPCRAVWVILPYCGCGDAELRHHRQRASKAEVRDPEELCSRLERKCNGHNALRGKKGRLMKIQTTVPLHRDWTKTAQFEVASGLDGAVVRRLEEALEQLQGTAAEEWPELRSIHADVWLTNVAGSETADFRYIKKHGQLVVNLSVDCGALPGSDLIRQREVIVGGVLHVLAVAFGKYRRERSRESLLDLTGESVAPGLDSGPASTGDAERAAPQWAIEVTLDDSVKGRQGPAGLSLLEALSSEIAASGLGEYEGMSFGDGATDVGFVSSRPNEVSALIHSFMNSAGINSDQYSVSIDED